MQELLKRVLACPILRELIAVLDYVPDILVDRPPFSSHMLKELFICSDELGIRFVSIPKEFVSHPELALGSRLVLRNKQIHVEFDNHVEHNEQWQQWLSMGENESQLFQGGLCEPWPGLCVVQVSSQLLVELLDGSYGMHQRWKHHFTFLCRSLGCSSVELQVLSNACREQVWLFNWVELLLNFGFEWEDDLQTLKKGTQKFSVRSDGITVFQPLCECTI